MTFLIGKADRNYLVPMKEKYGQHLILARIFPIQLDFYSAASLSMCSLFALTENEPQIEGSHKEQLPFLGRDRGLIYI